MKRFLLIGLSMALCFSCAKDATEKTIEIPDAPKDAVATKLIFSADDAQKGELLVKFNDDAIANLETSVSRSANTRSGIADFDEVLDNIKVKSIERLFPFNERNEAATREAGLHRWYKVTFAEDADLNTAARAMAEVAEVKAVQFNQQLVNLADGKITPLTDKEAAADNATSTAIFNDPRLSEQWHYINVGDMGVYSGIRAGADVNCGEAWKVCAGDPHVIVAVVDNCVDWRHTDLAANMWVNTGEIPGNGIDDDGNGYVDDVYGYNFVADTELTLSTSGEAPEHGTHVAGTIAAVNNNGIGICGIAGGTGNNDGVRIMSCQTFFNDETADDASVAKAIKYASDNGASIIQCSFGYRAGAFSSDADYYKIHSVEREAIDYFLRNGGKAENGGCGVVDGGIAIFAAGNSGTTSPAYPGAYRECICVTAVACDYTPAYYTDFGQGSNIAAPGGSARQGTKAQVLSLINNNEYGFAQGTSMACPHMSGVAALGLSYAYKLGKHFTRDEFYKILLTSVNGIDQYFTDSKYFGNMGTGLTDAYQVLMNVEGTPCVPVQVGKKQYVSLKSIVGGGASDMTFLGVSMSDADKTKLGVEGDVAIYAETGELVIKCTKPGTAHVTVRFVGGGTSVGSESNMGGLALSKEFVIVARGFANNNGWL